MCIINQSDLLFPIAMRNFKVTLKDVISVRHTKRSVNLNMLLPPRVQLHHSVKVGQSADVVPSSAKPASAVTSPAEYFFYNKDTFKHFYGCFDISNILYTLSFFLSIYICSLKYLPFAQ